MVFIKSINIFNGSDIVDIRNLNTFIQVAELKSFTRAGEKLGYSQPTISFQIKQLESELGVKLFDRIGHTVRLTDEGREVLAQAQQICHLCEDMIKGDDRGKDSLTTVRLAMADSFCTASALKGFDSFRKNNPGIALTITTGGTPELFRLLDHNEVDIVCTLDSHIYDTAYITANEEKIGVHLVAPAGMLDTNESITMEKLTSLPFLLTEKGMSYRRILDERLAMESLEITPVLEIGNAYLVCQLVEKGAGVSFLPDFVTQEAVERGTVVRVDIPGFEPELWKQVVYHRDKWVSHQMKTVIEHLTNISVG